MLPLVVTRLVMLTSVKLASLAPTFSTDKRVAPATVIGISGLRVDDVRLVQSVWPVPFSVKLPVKSASSAVYLTLMVLVAAPHTNHWLKSTPNCVVLSDLRRQSPAGIVTAVPPAGVTTMSPLSVAPFGKFSSANGRYAVVAAAVLVTGLLPNCTLPVP
jgi:hypothetical protein